MCGESLAFANFYFASGDLTEYLLTSRPIYLFTRNIACIYKYLLYFEAGFEYKNL